MFRQALSIEAYLTAKYFGSATIPDHGLISGSLINAVFYSGAQGGGSGNAGGRGYPLSLGRLGTRVGKALGSVIRALDYRGRRTTVPGAFESIGISTIPVAAYGLRRLFGFYEGPQIRVRRSTDNVEADVYMDSIGEIESISGSNTRDLGFWLNGATAFVRTWYDQSGGGKNAAQTSSTLQPILILSSSSDRSHLRFQSKIMQGPNLFGVNAVSNMHAILVSRENVASNNWLINLNGNNTGSPGRFSLHAPWNSNRQWFWDAGDAFQLRAESPGGVTSVGNKTLFSGYKSSAENRNGFRLNRGTRYVSAALGNVPVSGGLYIGNTTADHSLYELVVFSSQLALSEESNIETNMMQYNDIT